MQVHQHARPHIETHTRSQNHSAVAGAAYRLGLRLYDERQKCWHDFRKRALGEEVVRALTIAPNGAPSWATDPAQLWNRVEASEKRKDAQLARDYRIPVPFGLSDQDAGDLAEEMARFICDTLHVPVSLGLHRDADRDALGLLKPKDKQGFHAHLYFPTRRLADASIDEGGEGTSSTGFGAKLTELSNKNTSAVFVEMLNCKWSELANDFSRSVGSDIKFEYKSYKRLGLNLTPQPTLGQAATAMERKGIYTNRGDSLREALAVAHVYQKAHMSALDAQHAQAVKDVQREGGKPLQAHARALKKSAVSLFGPRKSQSLVQPVIGRQGSLAYRLRQTAPTPQSKEEAEELERSLVLIEALDKAFATYHELQAKMDELFKIIEATRAASLDNQFQADQSRHLRKLAQIKLTTWEQENRWRLMMFATMGGSHVKHEKLRSKVRLHDGHVQELKKTISNHATEVVALEKEASSLKERQADALSLIRNSLVKLDEAKSPLMANLLKEFSGSDRELLRKELPTLFQSEESKEDGDMDGLSMQDSVHHPEPARHKDALKW
ncbi:MAG TPA: MobA/MobL family protein [Dyella sp.]|uniref:MobA/MobL family protein n=1 Tax=Dyella sp. TaxID=1869338 RepID=UPI002C1C997A|nr:MobA/MobL family protein [Dyella sp.]HTV87363.1 MobA/MobL family protein [Dyella sp.]